MEKGCHLTVVKPRTGCGSEGARITSFLKPGQDEIWAEAKKAAVALGQSGYVGIDFVLGERPWVMDANARPTTSHHRHRQGDEGGDRGTDTTGEVWRVPEEVHVTGEYRFEKGELG